jgi:hypothetical protein
MKSDATELSKIIIGPSLQPIMKLVETMNCASDRAPRARHHHRTRDIMVY